MSPRSLAVRTGFMLAVALSSAILAQRPNLAVNTTRTGFPNTLASDPGWGGGAQPWDLLDAERTYSNWARGLAFTGGAGGWNGTAGVRQATVDFGANQTFYKVILWHHGHDHTPGLSSLSQIDYWDGTAWVVIPASRTFGRLSSVPWSSSDEYEFQPVTGSKVRWTFDNRQTNMLGTQIEHGWLYEFEVFAPQPSVALNPSAVGLPSPLSSDGGWGGGSYPWDLVDGQRTYSNWARGLAFTGGRLGWGGQPAGLRQATIELNRVRTFGKVVLWHHGHNHTPASSSLSQLAYWDGAAWIDIAATRHLGRLDNQSWSYSDEYEFPPVRSSKVRWTFDNRQNSILGTPIEHGWLYEFEVFATSAHGVFGAGCAGSAGVPTIQTALTGPRLSEAFAVTVDRVPSATAAIGLLGFSNTVSHGTPLPLPLGFLGMSGCNLLVSADLAVAIADRPSPNTARWTLRIPYSLDLLGVELFQQVFVADATANPLGLIASNGSRAAIGWE